VGGRENKKFRACGGFLCLGRFFCALFVWWRFSLFLCCFASFVCLLIAGCFAGHDCVFARVCFVASLCLLASLLAGSRAGVLTRELIGLLVCWLIRRLDSRGKKDDYSSKQGNKKANTRRQRAGTASKPPKQASRQAGR